MNELNTRYCKIPKISPGAYIFQRPFLRGLFLEGAFIRRGLCTEGNCISKSTGLACSGKEIYHFCLVLLCVREQIPCTSPPRGLYLEGQFNGGFFALRFWGAYIWRGWYMEGRIFRNFTILHNILLPCTAFVKPTFVSYPLAKRLITVDSSMLLLCPP